MTEIVYNLYVLLTAGVGDCVTVTHRVVCQNGFQLDHVADAVFLDLPKPWEAITSAKKALKLQGKNKFQFKKTAYVDSVALRLVCIDVQSDLELHFPLKH